MLERRESRRLGKEDGVGGREGERIERLEVRLGCGSTRRRTWSRVEGRRVWLGWRRLRMMEDSSGSEWDAVEVGIEVGTGVEVGFELEVREVEELEALEEEVDLRGSGQS